MTGEWALQEGWRRRLKGGPQTLRGSSSRVELLDEALPFSSLRTTSIRRFAILALKGRSTGRPAGTAVAVVDRRRRRWAAARAWWASLGKEVKSMRKFGFGTVVLTLVLAAPAYSTDNPIPVKVTVVKTGILFRFVSRQATPFPLPALSDDPTAVGGTLTIFDTDVPGNTNTYPLPMENWLALGNPPGAVGFKYKGTRLAGDPCRIVLIKPTVVKGTCKGPDVSLATPISANGSLAGTLTIGTGTRYCIACEGEWKKNLLGIFKSINCPAPPLCE
jgi:hypothetical protein